MITCVGATPMSWASGGQYFLGAGGWMHACAAGIQEGIPSNVWMIESTCWCISWLEELFKRSRWTIGCMERWQSVMIWAVCWPHERPHRLRRIQHPDNPFKCTCNGHGTCKAYSYQLCNVSESHCHECGEDRPELLLVVWGTLQDCSWPEKLRPSMCQHFSGEWIISTLVFIADIVHQALATITCSCAAMVYHCTTSIESIFRFHTLSPTEIRTMVAWLLAKGRFTCRTNVGDVSSMIFAVWLLS